jgi:23S rRNA pseudouridine1911/1915/1917 synthase
MNSDYTPNIDDELDETDGVMQYERHRFTVDRGQSLLRIDKYLGNFLPDISRNRIQDAAEAQAILVNDVPVKSNYRVKPDDVISIRLEHPPRDFTITPQDIPLNIAYEDDDLMVVNKPAGLVVHPACGNNDGTLLNALAWYMRDNPNFDVNNPHVGLVHRIDKDTSGLLLIAKTEDAKSHLGKQFFEKTTHRRYVALVWGVPEPAEGTITGNIDRDPKDRMLRTVFPPESGQGKHAVTHYRVLEDLGYVSLVECRLETGRTHQIRVHMKYIGHTLFSDERYGGYEILRGQNTAKYRAFVNNCFALCPRQALHAKELGFVHPRTGEMMMFTSEMPADMLALVEKWQGYAWQDLRKR